MISDPIKLNDTKHVGLVSLRSLTQLIAMLCLFLVMLNANFANAQQSTVNILGANNNFMVAESDQLNVNVNRPNAGPWEQWSVQQQGNVITLKSYWGKYLSAQPDGTMQVNRPAADIWERFQLVDAGNGTVALRTYHNKFLVTLPNGKLGGVSNQIGVAERFKFVTVGATPTTAPVAPVATTSPTSTSGNTTNTSPVADLAAVNEPTEFYWKDSYGRGVGKVADVCPAGKNQRGALCYDSCRDGYSDKGTLTCSTNCPSGYSDRGAICHYDGTTSYSPVRWDGCLYNTFLGCIGGTVEDGCRGGFSKRASMCYANLSVPSGMSGSVWDPTKGTYNLSPVAMVCRAGQQRDPGDPGGLCYDACRPGYSGVGPVCWAASAPKYVDCGMGSAIDQNTCALVIGGQVTSVLGLVKDICQVYPGISSACTQGAKAAKSVKAAATMRFNSVAEMLSPSNFNKVAAKSQKMMGAATNSAPMINNLSSSFSTAFRGLSGKSVSDIPEFGKNLMKIAEQFKDPNKVKELLKVAYYLRESAERPPFIPSGTPTEQAFKCIRDIAQSLDTTFIVYSLTHPGFDETPAGKGMALSNDVLSVIAAYLYTVPGQ